MARKGERDAILINYAARTPARPRYYANDHSRDTVVVEQHLMPVHDARGADLGLDTAGFMLVEHRSSVSDFNDRETAARVHCPEIAELLRTVTGADYVHCKAGPLMRFSERTGSAGSKDNSYPARFCHVDVSDETGRQFSVANAGGRGFSRAAHYNVWRVLSPAPQDVPLALLDARSLAGTELIAADAIFDSPKGDFQFEGLVVAHDSGHRWNWFADMSIEEAIIFKTHDNGPGVASAVPHVAFDDPAHLVDGIPRISIEMRAIAYWWS